MPDRTLVAAFDFDGTLSTTDSLPVFLRETVGTTRLALGALASLPWFAAGALRLIDRGTAKARFLAATVGGLSRETLEASAQRYADGALTRLIRPEMVERVRQHQALGHCVVLVSASPSLYLRPWARTLGFDDVLSTELAYDNGRFTGRFAEPNCWGPEKVRRLERWWGAQPPRELYVYGDSRGDREMAERANHAWIRGRDSELPPLPPPPPAASTAG